MKPTFRLFIVLSTILGIIALPGIAGADDLDATHDLRVKPKIELGEEAIPVWGQQLTDAGSISSGGSPFSQGSAARPIYIDSAPGLDVDAADPRVISCLEDLN